MLEADPVDAIADPNDARRVIVEEFKVVFEDERPAVTYRLDTLEGIHHMKSTPFAMGEGVRYKFAIKFRVNHAIVSGLRFRNKVKKTVLSTTDEIVLGSYAPRSLPYEFVFPRREWMDAPSGVFYRGRYMAQFRFVDDDKQEHLKVFYTFGTFGMIGWALSSRRMENTLTEAVVIHEEIKKA
jgi:Rho GDP-dissociation inhibitor